MPLYAPQLMTLQGLLGITLTPTGDTWTDIPVSTSGPLGAGDFRFHGRAGQTARFRPNIKLRDTATGGHVWFTIATVVDGAVVRDIELDDGSPPALSASGMSLDAGSPDVFGVIPALLAAADLESAGRGQARLRYKNHGSTNAMIDSITFGGGVAPVLMECEVRDREPTTAYVPVGQSHATTASGSTAVSYPTILEDSWTAKDRRVLCVPFAIAGSSFADRLEEGAGPHLWAQPLSFRRTILLASGGYQDIVEGRTAAQVMADHETQVDLAKAYGFDYAVGIPPTGSTLAAGFTQDQLDELTALNTAVLANANSKFDAVVDLRGDSRLADPTDTTYYAVDQLHYTEAGAGVVAELVEAATEAWVL